MDEGQTGDMGAGGEDDIMSYINRPGGDRYEKVRWFITTLVLLNLDKSLGTETLYEVLDAACGRSVEARALFPRVVDALAAPRPEFSSEDLDRTDGGAWIPGGQVMDDLIGCVLDGLTGESVSDMRSVD